MTNLDIRKLKYLLLPANQSFLIFFKEKATFLLLKKMYPLKSNPEDDYLYIYSNKAI